MCRKLATDNPYVYTPILTDTILSYMQMHSLYTGSLNEVSKALTLGQEAACVCNELSVDNPNIYAKNYANLFYAGVALIERFLNWNAWKLSQAIKKISNVFIFFLKYNYLFLMMQKTCLIA